MPDLQDEENEITNSPAVWASIYLNGKYVVALYNLGFPKFFSNRQM